MDSHLLISHHLRLARFIKQAKRIRTVFSSLSSVVPALHRRDTAVVMIIEQPGSRQPASMLGTNSRTTWVLMTRSSKMKGFVRPMRSTNDYLLRELLEEISHPVNSSATSTARSQLTMRVLRLARPASDKLWRPVNLSSTMSAPLTVLEVDSLLSSRSLPNRHHFNPSRMAEAPASLVQQPHLCSLRLSRGLSGSQPHPRDMRHRHHQRLERTLCLTMPSRLLKSAYQKTNPR